MDNSYEILKSQSRETKMTKTFQNTAEAHRVMSALHASGKISVWTPVVCFGRVTAKVWLGAGWAKLTEAKFAELVA
jgi:hypothetical protein